MKKLVLICIVFCSCLVFADTAVAPGPESLTDILSAFLIKYASSYPWLMLGFLVMAKARAILKPLFSLLHKGADMTVTTKDNDIIKNIEKHWALKVFCWFSDYLVSAKIVNPKKQILVEFKKLRQK
jgi:hypothetical protein